MTVNVEVTRIVPLICGARRIQIYGQDLLVIPLVLRYAWIEIGSSVSIAGFRARGLSALLARQPTGLVEVAAPVERPPSVSWRHAQAPGNVDAPAAR